GCACRPQGFPDLRAGRQLQRPPLVRLRSGLEICLRPCGFPVAGNTLSRPRLYPFGPPVFGYTARSEEHTSELQSREKLVCRLLLAAACCSALSLHDALPIWVAPVGLKASPICGRVANCKGHLWFACAPDWRFASDPADFPSPGTPCPDLGFTRSALLFLATP